MKHIKKKPIKQFDDNSSILSTATKYKNLDPTVIKNHKNQEIFIETNKGNVIKCFCQKINDKDLIIPFPDLTLVYFDSAYNLNIRRKEFQKKIKSNTSYTDIEGEIDFHEIYNYYGLASSCLISLFTTIESFVNHILPNDKSYLIETNKSTEFYTKEQIQRNIPFDDKVNKVLPFFFKNQSYFANQTPSNQHIINLKKLRNEIVHPKSDKNHNKQEELIKKIINFKYDETFEAVKSFINYYIPNYIEECDCGVDY